MEQTGFAVRLNQSAPGAWTWAVLDETGGEAASGETGREDVAREQAEFFRRSLTRFRAVTRGW